MKRVKFGVSRHFLEKPLRKWPEILHADVSWPLSELIRLCVQFVGFSNFDAIMTKWNGSNLGFPGILVMLCGFSSLRWPFGWNWSYLGFLGIIWRTCGSKCRGEGGGIFPTLCVEFCLVYNIYCIINGWHRIMYYLTLITLKCLYSMVFSWHGNAVHITDSLVQGIHCPLVVSLHKGPMIWILDVLFDVSLNKL